MRNNTAQQTCTATRADGAACGAQVRRGRSLCSFHDPECREANRAGKRAGGTARSQPRATLPKTAACSPLRSVHDVCGLLSETIHDVRTGRLDPKIANTVGYLAGVLVRAFEVGKLEERLAAIENTMRGGGDEPDADEFGQDIASFTSESEEE